MKYWILGCLLTLALLPAAAQRRTMPRGSFLMAPARTTKALLNQFDQNAEVRRRYLNIFGRSRSETQLILSRLTPKELASTRTYPVAYYTESGKWTFQMKTLPRGTQVFVTPEGQPFLKEECGNPLVISLPYPKGRGVATRPPIDVPLSVSPPDVAMDVAPLPTPELFARPSELFSPITTTPFPEIGEFSPPESLLSLIPEGSPEMLAAPGLPGQAGSAGWLALLLPFFFLGGGHNGGQPAAVPEASSWVLFLAGCAGIAVIQIRARRALQKEK